MTRISRGVGRAFAERRWPKKHARGASNTRHVVSMGIIPAAALDVAATFAADVLAAPDPAALAAALVALAITGLLSRGGGRGGRRSQGRGASQFGRRANGPRRAAVDVALLPRLPRRAPTTRSLRPAS